MKTRLFICLSILCVGILLVGPSALIYASSSKEANASIPFDFYVKDKKMPSGDYSILQSDSFQGVLWVERTANPDAAVTFVSTVNPINPINQAKLVFHKYGDQYFLAEIWNPILDVKLVVPVSHAEKEVQETIEHHQTSSLPHPEMVAIAMNFLTASGPSYNGRR